MVGCCSACTASVPTMPASERAYRAFFDARGALSPLVVEWSSAFDAMLADQDPPPGQHLPGEKGWAALSRWDAVHAPALKAIEPLWEDETASILITHVVSTEDCPIPAPRIAVLLCDTEAGWKVALDDGVWDAEWRIVRGSTMELDAYAREQLHDCIEVVAHEVATSLAQCDGVGGDVSVDNLRLRVAHASDVGTLVLVDYEDRRSWDVSDGDFIHIIGYGFNRTLLVTAARNDSDGWTCRSVRRIL